MRSVWMRNNNAFRTQTGSLVGMAGSVKVKMAFCVCLSFYSLTLLPPPLIHSEVRQTFRAAEMSGFKEAKLASSIMEQIECV